MLATAQRQCDSHTANIDDDPNVANQLPESDESGIHPIGQTSWCLLHNIVKPEASNDTPDYEEREEHKPDDHEAKFRDAFPACCVVVDITSEVRTSLLEVMWHAEANKRKVADDQPDMDRFLTLSEFLTVVQNLKCRMCKGKEIKDQDAITARQLDWRTYTHLD
eukprot:gnl/MRDRNA2_/MRDRNA2_90327_c0_seq1.p2 gnl/MRDRNA2_/MRDRNA2_90327_c0~~gnl/MRDRNA2_/MRDRNA2_90327_c0_seq1.p2  ORF type:complete len:164 (-),score=27.25 gnl/MRDRNA2_/MRDRNA2_90327_c0_seq1:77-568(-)